MFVQVLQGRVDDSSKIGAALRRWVDELSDGAIGWLGSTAGVTEDGTFIALSRFESADAARRTTERPGHGEWWEETSKLFSGDVTMHDSTYVDVDLNGDPGEAGFVQVIQGQGSDPERARELMSQDADAWADFRPDVIGSLTVEHEGGRYTMALYFSSEEAAREGETKEVPPELKAQMDEMDALSVGEPDFFNLVDPWLASPKS